MEKVITSAANETFKNLKALTTNKGRAESGLCIVEGQKIIFENLEIVDQVFLREGVTVTANLRDLGPIVLASKLYDQISDLGNGDGILSVVGVENERELLVVDEIASPAARNDGGEVGNILVLDRIQDPGNMGALIRSAVAFGFHDVVAINCVDMFSQKVIRAAMGMQFRLRSRVVVTSEEFFEKRRDCHVASLLAMTGEEKVTLVVADMDGEDVRNVAGEWIASSASLRECSSQTLALVLGNEGQGVDARFRELPHRVVTIPMEKGVESLNVGVAGGILMYELGKGE